MAQARPASAECPGLLACLPARAHFRSPRRLLRARVIVACHATVAAHLHIRPTTPAADASRKSACSAGRCCSSTSRRPWRAGVIAFFANIFDTNKLASLSSPDGVHHKLVHVEIRPIKVREMEMLCHFRSSAWIPTTPASERSPTGSPLALGETFRRGQVLGHVLAAVTPVPAAPPGLGARPARWIRLTHDRWSARFVAVRPRWVLPAGNLRLYAVSTSRRKKTKATAFESSAKPKAE